MDLAGIRTKIRTTMCKWFVVNTNAWGRRLVVSPAFGATGRTLLATKMVAIN
jgi:hypothetical protein